MFGIRINMEDELSSSMYRNNRNNPAHVKSSNTNCTVGVIEAQGFSFTQALRLINEVAPRRELDAIFAGNCYSISEEEILTVAKKYNIEI